MTFTKKEAQRIRDEIRCGTPDTPARLAAMKRADEIYKRAAKAHANMPQRLAK